MYECPSPKSVVFFVIVVVVVVVIAGKSIVVAVAIGAPICTTNLGTSDLFNQYGSSENILDATTRTVLSLLILLILVVVVLLLLLQLTNGDCDCDDRDVSCCIDDDADFEIIYIINYNKKTKYICIYNIYK